MKRSGPTFAAAARRTAGGRTSSASSARWSRSIAPTGPPANPDARYSRALQRLASGEVDQALAETMRLPGRGAAPTDWVAKARRYIAAHRALDEIESAALLTGPAPAR